MVKPRLKIWDKFFVVAVLLVLLIELGVGDIENFYFALNIYNINSLKTATDG